MRQAGLKPKNHSSGVYWLRASRGNQGPDTNKESLGFVLWLTIKLINSVILIVDKVKSLLTLK
jgi:hypothetical protein